MNLRNKLTSLIFAFVAAVGLGAATTGDTPQQKYIDKYKDMAVREMHRSGVPASITLAQGMLESRNGLSDLAAKGNNHFGIKCHGWRGKTMKVDDDKRNECFRVYDDAEQSFQDHSSFLRSRDRYKFLFDLDPTDYKSWAYGLKDAGYATDPGYGNKLVKLIEDYQLYRFDTGEDIPASPHKLEAPVEIKPGDARQTFSFPLSRQLYSQNGVPFLYSVEGETYDDIAREYDLFRKEILKYNDLKIAEPLEPGTIVYLQAKKKDAAKGVDLYTVGEDGESLREISQRFGIKLSALLKKNKLPEDYVTKEGDELVLRGKGVKKRVLY
ncbi:MAG: glucosaminidase domain-containing protein [Bacteroidales bacterium]|nr:glucosaminidase domain-containing protein [Bacteroidales bacterium]